MWGKVGLPDLFIGKNVTGCAVVQPERPSTLRTIVNFLSHRGHCQACVANADGSSGTTNIVIYLLLSGNGIEGTDTVFLIWNQSNVSLLFVVLLLVTAGVKRISDSQRSAPRTLKSKCWVEARIKPAKIDFTIGTVTALRLNSSGYCNWSLYGLVDLNGTAILEQELCTTTGQTSSM